MTERLPMNASGMTIKSAFLRTCLENVVGQASRLPLGRLAPVFSRVRRPFIAGRRPAPLFFRHAPRRSQAAFTLIEIMVVVVILGILAATIIPQFIGTTHDAKVSAAKSHIAELESALERFNVHMDRYPTNEEGLKVLVDPPAGDEQKWRGPYIK